MSEFYWPIHRRFLYFFLPMHILWKTLNKSHKDLIRASNKYQNNFRDDYAGKRIYGEERTQGGSIWTSLKLNNIDNDRFIKFLKDSVPNNKKLDVLEIGPGGGYYTNYFISKYKIKSYKAIEISNYFAKKLNFYFAELGRNFNVINGDALEELRKFEDKSCDIILFASTFHHLVDRDIIFKEIERILKKNGKAIFREPTHYIPRILDLLKKSFKINGYLNKKTFCNKEFIATHHFCTTEEFSDYLENCKHLFLTKIKFHQIKNKFFKTIFRKFSAIEMMLVITKK